MSLFRYKQNRLWAPLICGTILLYLAPLYLNDFILFVIAVLFIYMIWSASTWAIFHRAGQTLFAVVVVAAAGGYANALLRSVFQNTWITMVLGLLVSGAVGMFFFLMANRVKGHIQFAVLNLSFIFMLRYLLVAFTSYTGGIDGLKVHYFSPENFFSSISQRYLVVLTLGYICLFIIHYVMKSRFGKIITLIGRNPVLASTVGINNDKYIMIAYLIFTPMIGLGGILYSQFTGHISPEAWNPDLSLIIVFCTLIGGSNNIFGPIIGAIIAVGVPISFEITAEFRFGIVGVMAILIFVFKPEGVSEWFERFYFKKSHNILGEKT